MKNLADLTPEQRARWLGRHSDLDPRADELAALRDADRTRECPTCGGAGGFEGQPIGEHFVTREMAMDGGDPALEGQSMGVEYSDPVGCEACECTGRITREKWALLKAADAVDQMTRREVPASTRETLATFLRNFDPEVTT